MASTLSIEQTAAVVPAGSADLCNEDPLLQQPQPQEQIIDAPAEFAFGTKALPKAPSIPKLATDKTPVLPPDSKKPDGTGAYGEVFQVVLNGNAVRALKRQPLNPRSLREAQLPLPSSDHLLQRRDAFLDEQDRLCIVTDWLQGVTLADYAKDGLRVVDELRIDEYELRNVVGSVLVALQDLHEAKIMHNDVKPDNIMVTEDLVYLIDYGNAMTVEDIELTTDPYTDTFYCPKTHELFQQPAARLFQGREFPVRRAEAQLPDLYALGRTAEYCVLGAESFQQGESALDPDNRCKLSPELEDFLRCLLQPGHRSAASDGPATITTARQALQHPWIRRTPPLCGDSGDLHIDTSSSGQEMERSCDEDGGDLASLLF